MNEFQRLGNEDLNRIEAWCLTKTKAITPQDAFDLRNMLAYMVQEVRATRAGVPYPKPTLKPKPIAKPVNMSVEAALDYDLAPLVTEYEHLKYAEPCKLLYLRLAELLDRLAITVAVHRGLMTVTSATLYIRLTTHHNVLGLETLDLLENSCSEILTRVRATKENL